MIRRPSELQPYSLAKLKESEHLMNKGNNFNLEEDHIFSKQIKGGFNLSDDDSDDSGLSGDSEDSDGLEDVGNIENNDIKQLANIRRVSHASRNIDINIPIEKNIEEKQNNDSQNDYDKSKEFLFEENLKEFEIQKNQIENSLLKENLLQNHQQQMNQDETIQSERKKSFFEKKVSPILDDQYFMEPKKIDDHEINNLLFNDENTQSNFQNQPEKLNQNLKETNFKIQTFEQENSPTNKNESFLQSEQNRENLNFEEIQKEIIQPIQTVNTGDQNPNFITKKRGSLIVQEFQHMNENKKNNQDKESHDPQKHIIKQSENLNELTNQKQIEKNDNIISIVENQPEQIQSAKKRSSLVTIQNTSNSEQKKRHSQLVKIGLQNVQEPKKKRNSLIIKTHANQLNEQEEKKDETSDGNRSSVQKRLSVQLNYQENQKIFEDIDLVKEESASHTDSSEDDFIEQKQKVLNLFKKQDSQKQLENQSVENFYQSIKKISISQVNEAQKSNLQVVINQNENQEKFPAQKRGSLLFYEVPSQKEFQKSQPIIQVLPSDIKRLSIQMLENMKSNILEEQKQEFILNEIQNQIQQEHNQIHNQKQSLQEIEDDHLLNENLQNLTRFSISLYQEDNERETKKNQEKQQQKFNEDDMKENVGLINDLIITDTIKESMKKNQKKIVVQGERKLKQNEDDNKIDNLVNYYRSSIHTDLLLQHKDELDQKQIEDEILNEQHKQTDILEDSLPRVPMRRMTNELIVQHSENLNEKQLVNEIKFHQQSDDIINSLGDITTRKLSSLALLEIKDELDQKEIENQLKNELKNEFKRQTILLNQNSPILNEPQIDNLVNSYRSSIHTDLLLQHKDELDQKQIEDEILNEQHKQTDILEDSLPRVPLRRMTNELIVQHSENLNQKQLVFEKNSDDIINSLGDITTRKLSSLALLEIKDELDQKEIENELKNELKKEFKRQTLVLNQNTPIQVEQIDLKMYHLVEHY